MCTPVPYYTTHLKPVILHPVYVIRNKVQKINNNKSLMLKIYIATTKLLATGTMLVSNLPCWKFENKRSNANGMYAECTCT